MQTGHDEKADVWSLGITAMELAMGYAPYSDRTTAKVMMAIMNSEPPSLPNEDSRWDKRFCKLIDSCLQKAPSKRPSIT